MNESNRDLVQQIEQLVREHIDATRRAAAAAVERAFAAATKAPRGQAHANTPAAPERASSGRRTQAELSALAERLHELVCAQPGETMSVLAPQLGATSIELERPMKALKKAGRVRSVGQRHLTRYFPTVPRTAASAA
jgi:predicted Zn-dependent protease